MAITSIINTSLSGLFTAQQALRVTSNNITNVNTPGYARQSVSTEAAIGAEGGVGVRVAGIERVVDRHLESALIASSSETGQSKAAAEIFDRLQSALGDPDSEFHLGARVNSLFASLSSLAQDPAGPIPRQQFLSELEAYTGEISRLADRIQELRREASLEIEDRLSTLNGAIRRVFELNNQIVQRSASNGDTSSLENLRQEALRTVSENIDVRLTENSDGSIDVTTATGSPIAVSGTFAELSYVGPGAVGTNTRFPEIQLNRINPTNGAPVGNARPLDRELNGGALRGLIDVRDRQLVDLSLGLGELGARVADEINAVHNQFSAVPAPNTLQGKQTAYSGDDPHNFTGTAVFSVLDQNNQVVATTTYDFDANAGDSIDDVVDAINSGLSPDATAAFVNGRLSITANDSSHGVAVADDPGAPTDRAGRGFSHFFGLNDLLVARQPGIYETGVQAGDDHNFADGGIVEFSVSDQRGNPLHQFSLDVTDADSYSDILDALNDPDALGAFFTFSLDGNGTLRSRPVPGSGNTTFRVTADSTDSAGTGIGFSELFGVGERFQADAAFDLRVAERFQNDIGLLATAQLDTAAAVGDEAITVGDQSGILALQRLENKVVQTARAGVLTPQNRTLAGFNNSVLASFAIEADRAASVAEESELLQNELQERRDAVSGVNLDEELSNLVIFQNSYNAAARVLSTVQELYDSLLSIV